MQNIVETIYRELEFLTIEQTFTLEKAKFVHKKEKRLLPTVIANYFDIETGSNHGYNLRGRSNPKNIRTNTAIGRNSIQYVGEILWRELPQYLKAIDSVSTFKRFFKSFLLGLE